jgi:predicted amidohydrolase
LSLQIESAVRPHDNSVATALAAVEAAKAENSARIVVLHEAKDTGLPSDEATANAVKDVRERWKALEEQTTAAKTRAA